MNPRPAITITHTDAHGTRLQQDAASSSGQILRTLLWRYAPSQRAWYLPHTRGNAPRRDQIAATAEALRQAGHQVSVTIDTTPTDRALLDQDNHQRSLERAARLAQRADRHTATADTAYAAAQAMAAATPIGQPILVDHHNAQSSRAAHQRMTKHYATAAEQQRLANSAAHAASEAAAAHGATHTPTAVGERVKRLRAKVASLQRHVGGSGLSPEDLQRLSDHLQSAETDLAYWLSVRDEQMASGAAPNLSPRTVAPGDQVQLRGTWYPVVRANPSTVTLRKPSGSTGRVPWHSLSAHRRAEDEQ